MHPILKGDYPAVMRHRIDSNSRREGRGFSRLPTFTANEIAEIKGTADYFALNYYTSSLLSELTDDVAKKFNIRQPSWEHDVHVENARKPEWNQSQSWWLSAAPEGMGDILRYAFLILLLLILLIWSR